MTKVNKTISLDARSAEIAAQMDNFSEWIRMVLKSQDGHGNCQSCGLNKFAYEAIKRRTEFFEEQFNYAYSQKDANSNWGGNQLFDYQGSQWVLKWVRDL